MTLTRIDRHFGDSLVKLVAPYWGKPRMAALLQSYINQVQRLEDVCWDVLERYTVDGADTARLNVLGKIIGQPRFWADDEIYRTVIRGKIRANISRGLVADIVDVIRLATPITAQVRVYSFTPATMVVVPQEEMSAEAQQAMEYLLPRTRSAGVQMHVFFAPPSFNFFLTGISFDDLTHPGSSGPGFFDARLL